MINLLRIILKLCINQWIKLIITNFQVFPYLAAATAAPFSLTIKNSLNCLSLNNSWNRLKSSILSPSFLISSVIAIKFFLFLSSLYRCTCALNTACAFHSATARLRLSLRISSLSVFIFRIERFIAIMYFTSALRDSGFNCVTSLRAYAISFVNLWLYVKDWEPWGIFKEDCFEVGMSTWCSCIVLLKFIVNCSFSATDRDSTLSATIDLDIIDNFEGEIDLFLIVKRTNSSSVFLFSLNICISLEYCSFYMNRILSRTSEGTSL